MRFWVGKHENHLRYHGILPLVTSFINRILSYHMCSRNSWCLPLFLFAIDDWVITQLMEPPFVKTSPGFVPGSHVMWVPFWEVRTGFSVFHGQGLVEKLGRCLLPMVEIFDINSIEYDNDMVEIFDINSIEYDNGKRHIGQRCILSFF